MIEAFPSPWTGDNDAYDDFLEACGGGFRGRFRRFRRRFRNNTR